MPEGSRLRPRTMDIEGLIADRRLDKSRQHKARLGRLPWTDRVKEPSDHHWHLALLMIGERQALFRSLGVGIAPGADGWRPELAGVALMDGPCGISGPPIDSRR